MNLRNFYEELQRLLEESGQGSLVLDTDICSGTFIRLYIVARIVTIEDCSLSMQSGQVRIMGTCRLNEWNQGQSFTVEIQCREQEGQIDYRAVFKCNYIGTLGDFFGNVADTPVYGQEQIGQLSWTRFVADICISMPVISFDSSDTENFLPFVFFAKTEEITDTLLKTYQEVQIDGNQISGRVNWEGQFELEIAAAQVDIGIFPCIAVSFLVSNGADYEEDFSHSKISQAGLKLRLNLPQLGEVDFTLPLFRADDTSWNLHADFPDGIGIANIINFFMELFGVGGSTSSLYLPTDTSLNLFRLYQMDLLLDHSASSWKKRYLSLQFALAKPWELPIPYVTLERLYVGFQVSLGDSVKWGDLLTAVAGGTLSLSLGNYKLSMSLEMDLPELDFSAQTRLLKDPAEANPGLAGLADTFAVSLPEQWRGSANLLGEITVSGSGSSRYFSIMAEVYDILSFSIGGLDIRMSELEAGAQVSTNDFTFYVQGILEFGSEESGFALYLKAAYENPGWIFAGGIYRGTVDIGRLLAQMFQIGSAPDDISTLGLTELDISYATKTGDFTLTAAFEANWNIQLLGETFTLGGRLQIEKNEDRETDVLALVFVKIASFQILAQVNHIQTKENREFLFRISYQQVYLQAAWFQRDRDEILSINLGGMTLGGLVESLINMINPNKRYSLSKPWDLLNKIELSKFLMELNITQQQATFLYRAELDIAGLMYLDKIGVRYDMEKQQVFFILTGKLLGVTYDEKNPVTWDAIDGQPPSNSAEDERKFVLSYLGMGQHLANDGITKADSVTEAMDALKKQIQGKDPVGVSYDAGTNWLFGVDFTVNNMLNVKLVLNDPSLYGLLVTVQAKEGSVLEVFDGFGLELLCKRVNAQVYMFRGELLVPAKFRRFQLGVVSLTLGTIRLEVYTNGGFYLDLGFPYDMDFSRSFVLEWSIFTGRGGFYFGIMKDISRPNLPETTKGSFSPIVTLGIGLSVGLGRSFDLGIVKGGVSLEVFGILEGVFAIFHDKDDESESTYYYVKATAGISGRLYLSVDFKIITVQASAEVTASAALTIQAYRATIVNVDLALKVQASIKVLFIKINFSFSFRHTVSFTMGKDEIAPWEETGKNALLEEKVNLPLIRTMRMQKLEMKEIHLELFPLLYWDGSSYGAAFLMMMEGDALEQWTELLTEWILSHFPEDTISRQEIRELLPELSDTMTYAVLEEFLEENTAISYHIHWTEQEDALRQTSEEEAERFVFPILPSLEISFGEEENMKTVRYWDEIDVEDTYFASLSEYFSRLDPNPSNDSETAVYSNETLPIAKAFFHDYFQMFVREISGRIKGFYDYLRTEHGVKWVSEKLGISMEELLRQNQNLIFKKGITFTFEQLRYIVTEGDTLQSIWDRFLYTQEDTRPLWEAVMHETFLLRQGRTMPFGEGVFINTKAKLSLKEAAALLFVRFYEELIPDDMFYAGDIVRMNDAIDMTWEATGTEEISLNLPGWEKPYYALSGDTPQRLGEFLYLLQAERGTLPEWDGFYDEILERNQNASGQLLEEVHFYVENVRVSRDLDLADLAARIYPNLPQTELPPEQIFHADILNINGTVPLPQAVYRTPEEQEVTVSDVLAQVPCTLAELGQVIEDDTVFVKGQTIALTDVPYMGKAELLDMVKAEAGTIGAMLSRFLLQGLRVLNPVPTEGPEEELIPLYQALQQMFAMENVQTDMVLRVSSTEPDCTWVETEEKQLTMLAEEIAARLPSGEFSKKPSAFKQMDDFVPADRYFSIVRSTNLYSQDRILTLNRIPQAAGEVLHMSTTAPKLVDENGAEVSASWGCLIPIEIVREDVDGIFSVYGADAEERLFLHELLGIDDLQLHYYYQSSKTSKGGESFWEYQWSEKDSFFAKTNLSTETHMYPVRHNRLPVVNLVKETEEFVVGLDRTKTLLRMLWECSTVGGGGYYLQLRTVDGQTIPDDIFDENKTGTLWLMAEGKDFESLYSCINCCITANISTAQKQLTLVTADPAQKTMQPVFPVGCIGLTSEVEAPPEEEGLCIGAEANEETSDAFMRSMYQIVGYRIKEDSEYTIKQSPISAPVVPAREGKMWLYRPVVPVYRYAAKQAAGGENPYLAVGEKGRIVLEMRDILGNTIESEETEIMPYYNDVLIGMGQWPAVRVSYAITGSLEQPILKLSLQDVSSDCSKEALEYQRRAFLQLSCDDVEVELLSPVNEEHYLFSEIKKDGKSYLELLREYAADITDEPWELEFPLDIEKYPLPDEIFELKTVVVIRRSSKRVKFKEAESTSSLIGPYFPGQKEAAEQAQTNLLPFCREAQRVLPNLLLAQTADSNALLYGVTYQPNGYLKQINVALNDWNIDTKSEPVWAPEFYALRPLYNGFLNRAATVFILSGLSLSNETTTVNIPDVDMELWAGNFLSDIEELLLPEQIQKAAQNCGDYSVVNRLIEAKKLLAEAIAKQMMPLRQGGAATSDTLKTRTTDRLKRSLTEGYNTDVAASCQLSFTAKEHCRLTATAQGDMSGVQVTAGKADTSSEEMILFFTNHFTEKSIPLALDLTLPELEYDIEEEQGYESSRWLKLVEPVRLMPLESQIALPNPLKSCPTAPVLTEHICDIELSENEVDGILYLQASNGRLGWDYCLSGKYRYREQDTFNISIVFSELPKWNLFALQQDLFDVLAEYSMYRDSLWSAIQGTDGKAYAEALKTFTDIASKAAGAWSQWLSGGARVNRIAERNEAMSMRYSCTAEGKQTPNGIVFSLTSTEEGAAFLERMGMQPPVLEAIGSTDSENEIEFRFVMKHLPIFQCAQAEPYVQIVRNQNLLVYQDGEKRTVYPVNEEFIYRTQEVSLPLLSVTGEYTAEYQIAELRVNDITEDVMIQASEELLGALQIEDQDIMTGLSVSYYYGLSTGSEQPRVLLPVTMILPVSIARYEGGAERYTEELGKNMFDWYQETQPDTNCCGLMFDFKVYDASGSKIILHFANLKIGFVVGE